MRTYLAALAVLSIAAVAVAAPTYNHSWVPLGGGLYGHTFSIDNTGEPASAWFVEMEWWGAPAGEIPGGTVPGTMINQLLAFPGLMDKRIDEEQDAIDYDLLYPSSGYQMALDTWIMIEFGDAIKSCTEGPNYYERQSGTVGGLSYITVDHAYIVSDGSVKFAGKVGVGAVEPVWTDVSGYSVVPEPATLLLLGLGGLGLVTRRRRR